MPTDGRYPTACYAGDLGVFWSGIEGALSQRVGCASADTVRSLRKQIAVSSVLVHKRSPHVELGDRYLSLGPAAWGTRDWAIPSVFAEQIADLAPLLGDCAGDVDVEDDEE